MTNTELLMAISDMMEEKLEQKLEPINCRLTNIEERVENDIVPRLQGIEERVENDIVPRLQGIEERVENDIVPRIEEIDGRVRRMELTLENDISPRLKNIEVCYIDTYRRYSNGIIQIDTLQTDVDILKKVVSEHSKRIPQLA